MMGIKNYRLKIFNLAFWFCIFNFTFCIFAYAQSSPPAGLAAQPASKADEQVAVVESLAASDNVTLDFKEADIRNVLKIISYKAGVNIVTTPEVVGNVTIRLVDVPWENALSVILGTYGFAYERKGNIITVAPIDKLTALKKQEVALTEVQPTITEVFNLQYIDALDAKKALEPQLSPRGKITVLETTTQAGWQFASVTKGEGLGKQKRENEQKSGRSKILIISDVPPALARIKEVVAQIDIMPQQVLIETRIMEVSRDKLRDLGFDWGTGTSGATGSTSAPLDLSLDSDNRASIAGRNLASEFTPGAFNPVEGTTVFPGTYPYKAGLEVIFKRLTGDKFQVILHALEEDVNTNTLSAPRVMTLSNQEASILIGTKYPILKSDVTTSGSTPVTTVTLDYYQDIGIQLNVVPQVCAGDYINMVVHPSITSYTTTKGTNEYPVIDIREAETRVLMHDNETIVIGGLLKDIKKKEDIGIPFLSKIPLFGKLFTRQIDNNAKIDLLVFLTARIIKPGTFSPEEIASLEKRLGRGPEAAKDEAAVSKKKKKK